MVILNGVEWIFFSPSETEESIDALGAFTQTKKQINRNIHFSELCAYLLYEDGKHRSSDRFDAENVFTAKETGANNLRKKKTNETTKQRITGDEMDK